MESNKMRSEIVIINENSYKVWLVSIKNQIKSAQIKTSIAVNEEMLNLYWNIGKDISEKHFDSQYGSGFFDNLSKDLKNDFPDSQGFSSRNLRYMKKFYDFYKDEILHQAGAELEDILFTIPWRHHIEIFTRSKSVNEALFFVQKSKENGWSRAMLINMMDTRLYETRGNTLNNFSLTLPKEDSECAKEILKDEYKLDFLALRENYEEKDLHNALEQNLIKFLLQLGSGFAFVGSHVPFVVNGDEYECDLLFYHLKLRRYIVVELKVVKFEPEFISKLNFYCNAVNHLMKSDEDKNSIGLLICKEKNDVVAQWSLENSNEPIGISTYDLQNVLPSEKEIAENISQK
ncbi:MAG: PDDEXK nuclease domain-containing protein [Spirochaetales bacterium]|nr:PDDEXK nuclease domain-containing protein [Spirochaetia bacterium]MDD7610483.1 PDDEXK nuclease domain-containing protein [Spirochaetales bacterium]MDY5914228.1 PDDEXK nuclease domain-containing protein [Treponema sp.]